MKKNVVCLKWGKGPYTADWVNRLYRGVNRHLTPPFRFVCFADDANGLDDGIDARDIESLSLAPALTGIWWKLALMHPCAGLGGDCLFLDLDTVIIDDIDDFFTLPGRFCIIQNWVERRKQILRARPRIGNSSVFRFIGGNEAHVAEKFLRDPHAAQQCYPTEQAFMTDAVGLDNITWWRDDWVRSYKRHCLPPFPLNWVLPPRIPPRTKILAFHGRPKPEEAIRGFSDKPHKRALPMPTLAPHWL